MDVLLTIAIIAVFSWVAGNLVGWFTTRDDDVPWPLNWRILAGPKAYIDWAYARYGERR